MIFGHIPQWMATENPAFALAVLQYYSIREGQKDRAIVGEIAYWQMSLELLSRMQPEPTWDQEQCSLYFHLSARVQKQTDEVNEAVRANNYRYLRKLSACLKLIEERKKQAAQYPEDYQFEPVEYIFEAYHFLRRRDKPKGLPLPTKREVKRTAAIIRAFDVTGLMRKLPKFLWDPVRTQKMPGAEPTDKEFNEIERLRKHYIRPESADEWTYYLDKAGLGKLKQESRG